MQVWVFFNVKQFSLFLSFFLSPEMSSADSRSAIRALIFALSRANLALFDECPVLSEQLPAFCRIIPSQIVILRVVTFHLDYHHAADNFMSRGFFHLSLLEFLPQSLSLLQKKMITRSAQAEKPRKRPSIRLLTL